MFKFQIFQQKAVLKTENLHLIKSLTTFNIFCREDEKAKEKCFAFCGLLNQPINYSTLQWKIKFFNFKPCKNRKLAFI